MLLFVLPAELFKLSVKTPVLLVLFQLPPRMKLRARLIRSPNQILLYKSYDKTVMLDIMDSFFARITDIDMLLLAHRHALRHKRGSPHATKFNYHLMSQLNTLQKEVQTHTYRPMAYRRKLITEPKVRFIEAPAYRDRVVQHAIHMVLSPYYERFFIPTSYACRKGRGIHHASEWVTKLLQSEGDGLYVCQIDISKYYASINHDRLYEQLTRRIDDQELLDLLRIIIDSTDSGHEHDDLFPADSYFHTKGRRGIPIGNLTSQLFANIYLHDADMYAKQQLKIRHYIRYMDDILIFHHDKDQLHAWQTALTTFLYEQLYLTVNPRKVRLYPAKQGISFVGYVTYKDGRKLRGSSVRRFKRHYRTALSNIGEDDTALDSAKEMLTSWRAHAIHAKSEKLLAHLESWQDEYLFARGIQRWYKKQQAAKEPPVQMSLFD